MLPASGAIECVNVGINLLVCKIFSVLQSVGYFKPSPRWAKVYRIPLVIVLIASVSGLFCPKYSVTFSLPSIVGFSRLDPCFVHLVVLFSTSSWSAVEARGWVVIGHWPQPLVRN